MKPFNHRKYLQERETVESHDCYISRADGKYSLVYKGMPVCVSSPTDERAWAVAKQQKLTPTAIWDGDAGKFVPIEKQVAESVLLQEIDFSSTNGDTDWITSLKKDLNLLKNVYPKLTSNSVKEELDELFSKFGTTNQIAGPK